jgi:hypothetical protein
MTPAALCSGVSCAMQLYAPRSLKENTGCRSSRFNRMLDPTRSDSRLASSSGVSTCPHQNPGVAVESPQSLSRPPASGARVCDTLWWSERSHPIVDGSVHTVMT